MIATLDGIRVISGNVIDRTNALSARSQTVWIPRQHRAAKKQSGPLGPSFRPVILSPHRVRVGSNGRASFHSGDRGRASPGRG